MGQLRCKTLRHYGAQLLASVIFVTDSRRLRRAIADENPPSWQKPKRKRDEAAQRRNALLLGETRARLGIKRDEAISEG